MSVRSAPTEVTRTSVIDEHDWITADRVRPDRGGPPQASWPSELRPLLAPHQATFALFTTSRRRSSAACVFHQLM